MAILILMVGVPGSGKSTFLKSWNQPSTKIISRDEVRYRYITNKEEYFSKEDMVFGIFVEEINNALKSGKYNFVIADATHVSKASRAKTLKKVEKKYCNEVWAIVMNTPVMKCQENNQKRVGLEHVPPAVIGRMSSYFSMPRTEEGFTKIEVINWNDNNEDDEKYGGDF